MATEFKALSSRTSSGLVALVNQAIADGWQPFGSINTAGSSSIVMMVARGDDVTSAITEFDIATASSRALMVQRANLRMATGFKPFGSFSEQTSQYAVALIKGEAGGGATAVAWADVTGKPATFAPVIGTTATTAKAGNYVPAWSEVTGKPAVIGAGADAAAARTAIGAGTSNLVIGEAATNSMAGNKFIQASAVSSAAAVTSAAVTAVATNAELTVAVAGLNTLIAEFNKVRTDLAAVRTAHENLLAQVRVSKIIATA